MAGTAGYARGLDEEKINKHYQAQLASNKKSSESSGKDVSDLPHRTPGSGGTNGGPMTGPLMTWTKMLESLEEIETSIDQINSDVGNDTIPGSMPIGDDADEAALLDELNQIFTPILVMQGFEGDMSDKISEAFEEASVLLERNIIKFDDATRMSQLIAVCALLIDKNRKTPEFKTYAQAHTVANKTKLGIIKKNYEEAKVMAQKYLVKVATTNNSPVARNAANDLLPATQH